MSTAPILGLGLGLGHFTFIVRDVDRTARLFCEAQLLALGAEVKPHHPRVEGEGQSLYFYDFDNHLFELHTGTLAQRLARYAQGYAVGFACGWVSGLCGE